MPTLVEHSVNVFVYDSTGRPIPGAKLQVLDDTELIAEATYKGLSNTPLKVQFASEFKFVRLRASVLTFTREATVEQLCQHMRSAF